MKEPRQHSEAHLKFIRSLPCLVTGAEPTAQIIEAAHIRYSALHYGKRETGKAEKPHDCFTVPLCQSAHRDQHSGREEKFWRSKGIDPILVAALLWVHTGNEQAGRRVIAAAINGQIQGDYADGTEQD